MGAVPLPTSGCVRWWGPARSEAAEQRTRMAGQPPLRILIIDDEPGFARGLARLLGRDGATVETASDGHGSVHMTQDTCGKQILPTSPSACTYKASKADVPNAANVSCSPIAILRCVRRCKARCWTLIHCVSSSSISSSCGDANIV